MWDQWDIGPEQRTLDAGWCVMTCLTMQLTMACLGRSLSLLKWSNCRFHCQGQHWWKSNSGRVLNSPLWSQTYFLLMLLRSAARAVSTEHNYIILQLVLRWCWPVVVVVTQLSPSNCPSSSSNPSPSPLFSGHAARRQVYHHETARNRQGCLHWNYNPNEWPTLKIEDQIQAKM